MTVSAQTPISRSTGNGVTTVFPYTFKIISDGDIEVSVDDVVKTLNVDYTVSGAGLDAGGDVTMTTAPAVGTAVVRRRDMAIVRSTDYQDQGTLPAATLDLDIDSTVLMMQQLDERMGRTFSLPASSAADGTMPAPVGGYVLGWDALGKNLTNLPASAGTSLIDLAASSGSSLVGYTPAGAGAVATTVQAKFRSDDAGPTTVGNGTVPYSLASFYSNKNITQHAWYDFLADGTMDFTGNVEPIVGHASYNDNKIIQGSLGFDHHHSYQAYPHYGCSGTLNRMSAFWSQPDVTAGTIVELSQFKASNALGAGAISTQYGLYVAALTRGAVNYAIKTDGVAPCLLGGGVHVGASLGYGSVVYNTMTGNLDITPRAGYSALIASPKLLLGGSSGFEATIENAAGGNLEITPRTGYSINLKGNVSNQAVEGNNVLAIYGVTDGILVQSASGTAYNVASKTAIYVAKNTSTSRSINAAGTINASGADYAEYERNNGLKIAKGAVVGFKADGTLTNVFADAIRFGVKSTDPSLVGGDTWGNESTVGAEPKAPGADADESAHAAYAIDRAAFYARLEAERVLVDRVAYSGKVPCNVMGATPGGYIIAVADTAGAITGEFVADPDFVQYKKAVGRVNRLLPDGRCEVAVMVH